MTEIRMLDDEDVRSLLSSTIAVEAARRAVSDAYRGLLAAPPRLSAELHELSLVMTAGGYRTGPVGFRAYGTWQGESDQAVLLWGQTGRLQGVVVGSELGVRRTGALGAVAASVLARSRVETVAVLGSGPQAWSQLWALMAVRLPRRVRVFSPTERHRLAFAGRAQLELGLDAEATPSAEEAVRGADLIITATRSERPVLDTKWVKPGAHISSVGPKLRVASELPAAVAEVAAAFVSDSPAQALGYGEPFFAERELTHLGAIVCGEAAGRGADDDITVYCSTGLAGSEVVIAEALLAAVAP